MYNKEKIEQLIKQREEVQKRGKKKEIRSKQEDTIYLKIMLGILNKSLDYTGVQPHNLNPTDKT